MLRQGPVGARPRASGLPGRRRGRRRRPDSEPMRPPVAIAGRRSPGDLGTRSQCPSASSDQDWTSSTRLRRDLLPAGPPSPDRTRGSSLPPGDPGCVASGRQTRCSRAKIRAEADRRECSRNRPTNERTRMFSDWPGMPGRRQQMPRTIRSMWRRLATSLVQRLDHERSSKLFILMTIRPCPWACSPMAHASRSELPASRPFPRLAEARQLVEQLKYVGTEASRRASRPRSSYIRAVRRL